MRVNDASLNLAAKPRRRRAHSYKSRSVKRSPSRTGVSAEKVSHTLVVTEVRADLWVGTNCAQHLASEIYVDFSLYKHLYEYEVSARKICNAMQAKTVSPTSSLVKRPRIAS